MSFLWQPAEPITMLLHKKQPEAFEWRGREHRVKRIENSWRMDWGWWRVRLWRDYYRLVTHSGLVVLIYRDLLDESWYIQQLYD